MLAPPQFKRFGSNPLIGIEKVKTEDGQTQVRRALGIDEMVKLLAAAGDRRLVYLMAVHTGLLRSELGALLWGDLHLDDAAPFLRVRASTTKDGKPAKMRVHLELLAALSRDDAVGLGSVPASGAVCRALAADRTPDGSRTVGRPRTLRVRREGAQDHSRGGCASPCQLHRPG